MKRTIAVDFDGVIAVHEKWQGIEHFGEPIPGVHKFLLDLTQVADVCIHTCRLSPRVNPRVDGTVLYQLVFNWLVRNGLLEGTHWSSLWCERGKPIASAYIDDRAIACRPQETGQLLGTNGTGWYDLALVRAKFLVEQSESVGVPGS